MGMKFMEKCLKLSGLKAYSFAKQIGVPVQMADRWLGKTKDKDGNVIEPEAIKLRYLCSVRQLAGLDWEKFGKMLDDEFLPKVKK